MRRNATNAFRRGSETEQILGQLLSRIRTLEGRAVQRWGGVPYRQAIAAYEAGDAAYLERDYDVAQARYNEAYRVARAIVATGQ